MRKTKYDWKLIQAKYDEGLTWRDIQREFGVASASIAAANLRGDFIPRNKSQAARLTYQKVGPRYLSEETKQKISRARIKFLEENPDKVPYVINHSSNESYPEKIFRNALESSNITGWVQSYRTGIYAYDFAFPDLKVDVEIDGDTHKLEKVKKIDKRRDKWSIENGWSVIRFEAREVKEDVIKCIRVLREHLDKRSTNSQIT